MKSSNYPSCFLCSLEIEIFVIAHHLDFCGLVQLPIISQLDLLPDLFSHHLALPPSCTSIMCGTRAHTVPTLPQYERVIWMEKKTARGSKISAKVSNSP
jgi:hypothetical protein